MQKADDSDPLERAHRYKAAHTLPGKAEGGYGAYKEAFHRFVSLSHGGVLLMRMSPYSETTLIRF